MLRILTLNLGLLGISLSARFRIEIDHQVARRLAAAPALLQRTGAEVLVLQEVYSSYDRRYLRDALAESHPYSLGSLPARSLIGNGLFILSRHPLCELGFIPCPRRWWSELLWRQGFLLAEVDHPELGPVRLANVHLSSGRLLDRPDARSNADNSNREIDILLHALDSSDNISLLIGDFNNSPAVRPEDYERIIDAGYTDAYTWCNGSEHEAAGMTWDAANRINSTGRYRRSPSQRIDHVFIRSRDDEQLSATSAKVVLRTPEIATPSGPICLSDHYALLVRIDKSPSRDVVV